MATTEAIDRDVLVLAKQLHDAFNEEAKLARAEGADTSGGYLGPWETVSPLAQRYYRAAARRVIELSSR